MNEPLTKEEILSCPYCKALANMPPNYYSYQCHLDCEKCGANWPAYFRHLKTPGPLSSYMVALANSLPDKILTELGGHMKFPKLYKKTTVNITVKRNNGD